MDLSTMESKLKEKKYTYVRDFMADLDQMITNSSYSTTSSTPSLKQGITYEHIF